MENNLEYSSSVKKGLIKLLMFTLYADERTIYREYVQNALDSINQAVKQKVLRQVKDGLVKITIDDKNKIVTIKDNGTGICQKDAIHTLLDISASTKDGINQAGQFGIGRLVGGGYCHQLVFRTTAVGESVATQITFDVDKIWKMVEQDDDQYLATYVIDQCTKKEYIEADKKDHYFEVILTGVRDDKAPALLDCKDVVTYLNAVAPVEYRSEFTNTLIHSSTEDKPKFRKLHKGLAKIQLFVNETRIQKQYGLQVSGTKDEINNLEYFELKDDEFGQLGWGWFALTKFTVQIPKDDPNVCIRLRHHNIQIGSYNQLSGNTYWKEERSNAYFYGEFFVTHPNIGPNAARDGLAPTPETNRLNIKLREYFDSLKSLYTKANEAKKCIDKIKEGIERLKKSKDINDYNAKDLIDNKGISKFEKLVNNASFGPIQRMLALYQPCFEEVKELANKERAALSDKNSNTEHPLVTTGQDNDGFNQQSPIREEIISKYEPSNPSIPTPSDFIHTPNEGKQASGEEIEFIPKKPRRVKTVDPSKSQSDMLAPLLDKYDQNDIWIIRRIFRVLNTYCPSNEHDQKLILELERMIVKEFQHE